MIKPFIFLIAIWYLFISCGKNELQNLDMTVNGHVLDQGNTGVAGVTIYIRRGGSTNFMGVSYETFDSVSTDVSGKYTYLIKYDKLSHRICCKVPVQYSGVDEACKNVDESIIDGRKVSNVINFRLN